MPVSVQNCSFLYIRGLDILTELSHYHLSKPNSTSSWRQLLGIPLLTPVTAVHAMQFSSVHLQHSECTSCPSDVRWIYRCRATLALPGFTTLSLLSYANLEESADGYFSGMKPEPDQNFQINSKITTITVSNNDTRQLSEPVKLTFYHLNQVKSPLL